MQGTQVRSLVWEDSTQLPTGGNRAHTTTTEPVLSNKRSHREKKSVPHNEEQPQLATTRESPHTAMKTQDNQK